MFNKCYLILTILIGLLLSGCDNSSKNNQNETKEVINSDAEGSAEIIIDMLNIREDGERMVYSQDVVNIEVGDTVNGNLKMEDIMLNLLLDLTVLKSLRNHILTEKFPLSLIFPVFIYTYAHLIVLWE